MITRKCTPRQSRGIRNTIAKLGNNWNGKNNKKSKSDENSTTPNIGRVDPWERVNINTKKRAMTYNNVTGYSASEKSHGRSLFEGERSAGGSTTEHPFPVHPVYPRIADPISTEQKKSQKEEKALRTSSGSKWFAFYAIIGTGGAYLFYDLWFHFWKYFVPLPVYSTGRYAEELDIQHVIFLDVSVNGDKVGRIHIGLFHNGAPNFTENLHRLATGNNENNISLVGTKFWKANDRCLYGGDIKGTNGKHGVVAKGKDYIPEDKHNNHNIPFGVYAGGAFIHRMNDMNDSNFLIAMDEGRTATQGDFTCAGMVLRGYNIVEMISNLPREPYPYLLDCVEVTASGVSPLSGDLDKIKAILERYHDGRLKRFLAKQPVHRQDHEYYGAIEEKHIKMEQKRKRVEEELKGTKLA